MNSNSSQYEAYVQGVNQEDGDHDSEREPTPDDDALEARALLEQNGD